MLNKKSTNDEGLNYFNESLSCLQQSCVSVKYLLWLQLLLLQCDGLKIFFVRSFLVRIFPHLDWIRIFTPHISVLSPNAGKCRPEKLQTRILFTQCVSLCCNCKHTDSLDRNSSFIFVWIEISKSWHEALTRSSKKMEFKKTWLKLILYFFILLLFANSGHCVVLRSPYYFPSVNRFQSFSFFDKAAMLGLREKLWL